MKALILAGGKGTRIKKFTDNIKPLIVIAGKPILSIQLEQLKKYEVSINCNKEHEKFLRNYGHLIIEEKRFGKATPLKLFSEDCKESFLVLHCDVFSNIDFDKLVEEHIKSGYLMTMVVKNIAKHKSFGVTVFDNNKIVTGFTRQRYVNCGVYVCRPEIKNIILNNIYQDIDRDLIPKLIEKNQLNVYIHNGFWYDVGTVNYWNKHRKEEKKEFGLKSKIVNKEKK
ncbi:MAG: NDP-sugar synthase [Candidatus Hodarchaeota archaeon]